MNNSLNPKVSTNKFWYALYTRTKHEFKTVDYLTSINIESYLPTTTTLKQWSDRKKKITEPLFKSYVFIYCNEPERFQALQYPSVISTVSFKGEPARIPDWQIENLKKFLAEERDIVVQDQIKEGTKVKIQAGPFKDVTGVVVQGDDKGKMFGVTIDLLRRSVLVKLPAESIIKVIDKD